MESGTRKKRTLAERRESDKLRQRRFRAKKREEARLLQVISGVASGDGNLDDKKERNYATPRKTADEIRETNRIRQQRFRAKKRTSEDRSEDYPVEMETELEQPVMSALAADPARALSKIIVDALNEAKQRQTEVRREKDRLRKRKERQRKKENELRKMGIDPEDVQKLTNNLEEDEEMEEAEEQDSAESPETLIKQEVEDPEHEGTSSSATNGFFDSIQFMSQLEQMDLLMKLANSVEGGIQIPDLNITPNSPDTSMTLEELGASSSPVLPTAYEEILLPEKKPWQRCSSSEERRERERMRKRMYRAKQKFISTGKLEMQWDPAPIKRIPNDEVEVGITPLPEWTKHLSSEQKQAAHRIYNKRYRERMRNNAGDRESPKESEEATQHADIDFSNLSPETYKEILATISQCDLSSLVAQSNA